MKPSNSLFARRFPTMTTMSFLSLISTLIFSHFQLLFLGIDLLIGEALYHVHYRASRDMDCIFALNWFVIFPPV